MTTTIANGIIIGHYVVTEPTEFTNQSFETAGWWETYLVQPGAYPLTLTQNPGGSHWVNLSLPGVVVSSHLGPGGVNYGVGKAGAYHRQLRPAHVAQIMETDACYRMNPGVQAVTEDTTDWHGRPYAHTLLQVEAGGEIKQYSY